MSDARGVQVVQAVAHAGGPGELPAVRSRQQAALAGDGEGPVEVAGHPAPLVVGEPEADDAPVRVAHGEPGQGAGVQRVLHPVGGDHHAHAQAGVPGGAVHGVEDDLDGRDQPAEQRGVRGGVDLDLQPAGAVRDVLLGALADQAVNVLGDRRHDRAMS